ncbi:High-affinity glucose transporter [Lachnellula willkommii]|uniref:High-affinity glucose transporter n=1 Tax=Lachnellula willkommii TaxID=215461 RepID=A0A559M998_9HELO|nr:High-affinity glucose transporter [Lachnellula willkommii]
MLLAFIATFGVCSSATHVCAIPPYLASIMNSFPYLGKLIRRYLANLSFICSAVHYRTNALLWNDRFKGICVIVMPAFMAECAPASLRGMITSQLQGQIVTAQLIATVVNYKTSTIHSNNGWRIYVGIQFVMPVILLLLFPFIIESPRWLLSAGRIDEASKSLQKLRKKTEYDVRDEMSLLASSEGNEEKGTWKEVFDGNNRRRTGIAIIAMVGQQITGQAFATQYSVVFYKQQGSKNSFALGLIMQGLGVTAVLITTTIMDSFRGRRLLIGGGIMPSVFLYIMGSIGTITKPSDVQKKVMVAGFMLFFFLYLTAWASLSYVVLGEASTRRLVEKTNNLAVSLSVITAFVVSFTVPYLISAQYANLGGKVSFIYRSLSILVSIMIFIFIPEMKGRSLEELDTLFAEKTPTRSFRHAVVVTNVLCSEKGVTDAAAIEAETE